VLNRFGKARVGGIISAVVHGVLLGSADRVRAADVDPAVAELTTTKSTVELGVGDVSSSGPEKLGEYSGFKRQGAFVLGDVDLQGGGSYDSNSTTRWRLRGSDLGLGTRDAELDYREQGTFKFNLGYQEFRHNQSDTYQTPYLGAGSASLTLPADWIKPVVPQVSPTGLNFRSLSPTAGQGSAISPTGAVVAPTAAQLATLQEIVVNDTGAYHNVNLQTERKRADGGISVNLSSHLQLTGSVRHETQKGLQEIGAVTAAVAENSVLIPKLIDTATDQFNLGVEYSRGRGFLQAGYYGSNFRNDVNGMFWQDPNDPARTATQSSAPSNQLQQFNAAGGYSLSSSTRLTADVSYGRNRQNDAFLTDPSLPLGVPENSAHALVVTEAANLKLSMQPLRRLSLLAHYKYDDRNNRTPINMFEFYDVNLSKAAAASPFNGALGLAPNTLGSNINIFDNRPESKKLNQLDLDADYALGAGQKLAGGFQWQKIERNCDGSWINCVNAGESIERTLHAKWRASLLDSLDANIGYSYARRRVNYDPNAWLALVPMANVVPGAPTVGATTSVYGYLAQTGLTGFGPLTGFPTSPLTGNAAIFSPNNNIVPQSLYASRDNLSELPGMRRFDMANRNRNKLRSSVDWQASERISTQGTFELTDDDYADSTYGLQRATSWAASLDGTYTLSDRLIVTGFYTHENQRQRTAGDGYGSNSNAAFVGRAGNTAVAGGCFTTVTAKNTNGKVDPCLNWSTNMLDRADTVGFSVTKKALISPRFDFSGDVIYTHAQTDVDVRGGSYSNNPFALAGAPVLAAGVPAILYIPAANLPAVTTSTLELRLTGRLSIGKSGAMRVFYSLQRTKNVDFAYDGLQFGTGTEQLPTNERAPDYTIHVVGLSYAYRF
jgi:MtrB/PioB family decaheme-associated outer membrane protein